MLFQHLQTGARVEVWLYDNTKLKLSGKILGFDEFMNLVLGDAQEHHSKSGATKTLGTILLKGDTITALHRV